MDKIKIPLFVIFVIVVFVSIFILNLISPFFADDWVYLGIFRYNEFHTINNLSDIFLSQYTHYKEWGGRVIVHTIDQIILQLNDFWRAFVKSICFVMYIYLVYLFANKLNRGCNLYLIFFLSLIIYAFIPSFEETILWTTGASNYLFGTTIVILFLYPFYSYFTTQQPSRITYFIFLFGIIAGWTNENTVAAVIALLFLFLVYFYFKKYEIPRWLFLGFAGLCIGYAIMILAPGNFLRVIQESNNLGIEDLSTISIFWYRIDNVFTYYRYNFQIVALIIVYISMFLLYIYFKKNNLSLSRKKIQASVCFFGAGNLSSWVMLAAPLYPIRATFPMVTFFFIAIGILYSELLKVPRLKKYFIFLTVVLALFSTRRYYYIYQKTSTVYEAIQERDNYIADQKKIGNLDIVLSKQNMPNSFFTVNFFPDPDHWINKSFCKANGLNSIRTIDPD